MGTLRDRKFMLVCAALTTAILIVGAGVAGDYGQNQQPYGDQTSQQGGFQSGSQMGSRAGTQGNRNQPLEKQVAGQLRDQGLGQQGQILVLAVGNRVILLGQVPDQNEKQQADQITRQASGVGQVDNRLVVLSETARKSDAQWQQDIQQQLSRLPGSAGQNIQVQSRNGRIILRGQVDNWLAMADAIQAAFTAGAPYVVSQITTSGQGQYAGRFGYGRQDRYPQGYGAEAGEQYGQYGYQPPEEREYDQGYDQDRYQGQQYGRGMGTRDLWRQTGEDRRAEQRLTSELRSNVQGIADITILVAGNKAFLFGRAQSEDAKDKATLWIQQVSGIRRVQNDLIVAPQGWQRRDDAAIQDTIRDELQASPHLNAERIRVSVRNGVATLSGRIDAFGELVAAVQSAYRAGARTVQNRLTVTGQTTAGAPGTRGGYYPSYGYRSDQGYGAQGGYSQPYSGTSDQSMGGGTDTWSGSSASRSGMSAQSTGVLYQYRGNGAGQSMNRGYGNRDDQNGYYPSYGYTPSESDEQSEETDEDEIAQVGRQRTSEDEFTPGSQQRATGQQRMSTADMILAQRVALELQRQLPGEQIVHVLDPRAIYVVVNQGTVTLHGFVQDSSQKQQAEQIARSIRGVQTVQNQLLVAGQGAAFPPLGYVPGSESQTSRGQQGAYQGGYTTGTQQRTTGQQMTTSDRTLTQQIDQQIRQQLSSASISVTVNQGTATLQGSVQDSSQKQQAEQIARSISGVRSVQNNITVSGQPSITGQPSATGRQSTTTPLSTAGQQATGFQPASASDKILAHQVALELQQQLPSNEVVYVMDQQAINVMVTQGTVMLHGSVPDQNLRQQAEQIARTVSGARNVRNELTIMGQMQRTAMGTMGQPQQMTATDSRLADQIEQQIHQQLPSANIDVMVSQGTVMLHGSVPDQSQKQQAEQIAKSVSGVQTVQNNLTVGAAGTGFPPLGYIPGQQDTGSADDIRCTQMLKQSLTNQNLKDAANNIFVTCHNGQMALYGNVKTDDEKDQIDRAAKQVQGIKNVDNNLTVSKETAQQKSDVQLKEDVESQLWWSPFVDSSKIDVAAQDGVVTLSGTVKGWDAEKAAVKNAFDAGARRVRSKLQIEGQPSTAMGQTGAGRDYGTTQQ